MTLEDLTGGVELTVFSRALQSAGSAIAEDAIVAVKARVNRNDDRMSIMATEVEQIVLSVVDTGLHLNLPAMSLDKSTVGRLKSILTEYPGPSEVHLHIGNSKVLCLGPDFTVDVDRVIPPLRVAFGSNVIR
jgi:DNA polymerase III alpha subunit